MWENTAPGTEFAYGFCAGIGPLQLGVALVLIILTIILLIVYTREGILKQMNNQTVIIVQHVFLFGV